MEVDHMTASSGELHLQDRYGTQRRAGSFYDKQVLGHLNEEMQRFVGRMEMVFIATADATGEADCSFRAGPAGFVRVLDDTTLAYPELRGNGVMASLGNVVENGHIGMLFIDFYESTIGLHVNGGAQIVEVADMLGSERWRVALDGPCHAGTQPERWVVVDVHEAYIHCSKHVPLVMKLDKAIAWGTDDAVRKGGDYFGVGSQPGAASAPVPGGVRDVGRVG
jgi:predicted pyridoxine 5'-phosphate oxidase superfamily flavin-nucleotide-binding protein